MNKIFASLATLFLSTLTAQAQEAGDTSVALGLSTFGGNLEAAYRVNEQFRVRGAVMGGFSFSDTEVDGAETTKIDANLGGFALLADYYPTQTNWRVSGGLFFSNSDFEGLVSGDVEVNGTVFPGETVDITANFKNEVAPMITTGFDSRLADDWRLNTEFGLIFTGGVDLTATSSNAAVQTEIDADTDYQNARSDAADVTVYPYLGLTVSYQF